MDPSIEGLRLLLVEDEFVLAVGLSDTLSDLGADVLGPVASVADAMGLVENVPEIDAAILDVNLGNEVVYPVADALLARGIPFFFATANSHAQLPQRFQAIDVCEKPFDHGRFRQLLARVRPAGQRLQVAARG